MFTKELQSTKRKPFITISFEVMQEIRFLKIQSANTFFLIETHFTKQVNVKFLDIFFTKHILGFQGASRLSSISNVNIFFFVYIVKQKNKLQILSKNFVVFHHLIKIELFWRRIFEILIIYKSSLGTCDVSHKILARLVQPF